MAVIWRLPRREVGTEALTGGVEPLSKPKSFKSLVQFGVECRCEAFQGSEAFESRLELLADVLGDTLVSSGAILSLTLSWRA